MMRTRYIFVNLLLFSLIIFIATFPLTNLSTTKGDDARSKAPRCEEADAQCLIFYAGVQYKIVNLRKIRVTLNSSLKTSHARQAIKYHFRFLQLFCKATLSFSFQWHFCIVSRCCLPFACLD